jgi:ribosome recycling factor
VEATANDFKTVRTGRASTSLVENLKADYYGTPTPLKQLANIAIPEPRLIVIQPWDANAIKDVERAIRTSDLGLQPMVEGKIIRISVPPLNKERREELVKVVKKMAEDGKIALRTIRRDGNDQIKKLEKDKKITEDDREKALEEIQKLTDRNSKTLDQLSESKEKELVTV